MCRVAPSDIVLAYLQNRHRVTETQLMRELHLLCNGLVDKGVFTAIDFTFYKDRITSDVIQDSLWEFTSSGVIDEHRSELSYEMSAYGETVSEFLLQSFKETDAWGYYTQVLETIT